MLSLSLLMGREHVRDLRAAAERPRTDPDHTPTTRVTLRYGAAADSEGLRRLAQLDGAVPPRNPVLIAEVDGRLRAALPLDGGAPIADPFHRGAELVELLRIRAGQLHAR